MEVQDLDKNKRNSIIREVCKQGAGFRQLARITGISYGIIQRVATDQRVPWSIREIFGKRLKTIWKNEKNDESSSNYLLILCYTYAINRWNVFIIVFKPTYQYQCFNRGQTYSVYHQYSLNDILYNSHLSALGIQRASVLPTQQTIFINSRMRVFKESEGRVIDSSNWQHIFQSFSRNKDTCKCGE